MATKKERGLKQLPDGRWRWSFQDPEGRIRNYIARTKSEARVYLEKVRTEIREGRYLNKRKRSTTNFQEAAERFLETSQMDTRRSTHTMDKMFVEEWKEFPRFAKRGLTEITQLDVEAYKKWCTTQPSQGKAHRRKPRILSKRSVDMRLSRLKRMFNLCIEWGLCESNPVSKVKQFREDNFRARVLSSDEETKLLEAADPVLGRIIRFALLTGMRRGEILGLRWSDLDLRNAVVNLPATRVKGKRDRHIHLHPKAVRILEELPRPIDGGALVFGNSRGHLEMNINRLWREAIAKAKIQDFRFHDLRHTFASRLVMKGVDLYAVKELLGHQSTAMTQRYAHLQQSRLKEALRMIDDEPESEEPPKGPGVQEGVARYA